MSSLALQLIKENKQAKNKFLDLGNCGLTDLPDELFDCTWLERLNIAPEYAVESGKYLHAHNQVELNQVRNINKIKKLVRLKALFLSYNKIEVIEDGLLDSLTNLWWLDLRNNPVENVLPELLTERNCLQKLKIFFRDKKYESAKLYESKIILVGNGSVGKTTLAKKLVYNSFDPKEKSTHAIQIIKWQLPALATALALEKVQINIWDFGGQDIYHATHRLFLKTKALFILVWDEQTEKQPEQIEINNGRKITFKNYSLQYWLSYIKALSANSPVILVQSKAGLFGESDPAISSWEKKDFNVRHTLSIESSENLGNGFENLKEKITKILKEQIQNGCIEIPAQWYRVKENILRLQQDNIHQITIDEFNSLCIKDGLDDSSIKTLLGYLHDSGVFFYRGDIIKNEIVLNQKRAIDAVYKLFDRNGFFIYDHRNGLFSEEDLKAVWSNYNFREQSIFMGFMLECSICFEVQRLKSSLPYWPFHTRIYVAPQLLPQEKPVSIGFAFNKKNCLYFKYQHRYLHAAVIQQFIVRVGFLAEVNDMWRDGVLINTAEGVALIEAFPEMNQLLVRIDGLHYSALLDKIRNELREINQDEEGIEESVSLDNEKFVLLENIRANPVNNVQIKAVDGSWVNFRDYRQFLSFDEMARFERAEAINIVGSTIYFSYAWNAETDKLVDALGESLQEEGCIVVRDKKDLGYKGLISKFMQEIGKGNFVVVVISDKYLKSPYCMYELYEVYRNSKLDKDELLKKILPVYVENINLGDSQVVKEYFEHWKKVEMEWRELVNEYGVDQGEHRKVENIKNALRDLLPYLKDINTLNQDELSANNFIKIKVAILNRVKEMNTP